MVLLGSVGHSNKFCRSLAQERRHNRLVYFKIICNMLFKWEMETGSSGALPPVS